jgi:hypothetical protein
MWLFFAVCALIPLDILWVCVVLQIQAGQSFDTSLQAVLSPALIGQWGGSIIGTGLWTLYVKKSRRVANTFVR